MSSEEEINFKENYPYAWSQESHNTNLEEFLKKYRPSMVVNDGEKPWLWVKRISPSITEDSSPEKAIEEATVILKETALKVDSINSDASIPTRSNKKTGARSKKELREELAGAARDQIREVATKYKYTVGKWLIFSKAQSVDDVWRRVSTALISGELSRTPAFLAKVSTSPANEASQTPHVICIYLPNLFNKDEAANVLRVLVRDLGITTFTAKPDIYTLIGLDSKHASGIRSTIWQTKELLSDDEIKKLANEYSETLKAETEKKREGKVKPKPNSNDPVSSDDEDDNPFASSSEDEAPSKYSSKVVTVQASSKSKKKEGQTSSTKRSAPDEEDSTEEEVTKPKAKTKSLATSAKTRKPPAKRAKKFKDSDSDHDS